jgi:hypothetical protein
VAQLCKNVICREMWVFCFLSSCRLVAFETILSDMRLWISVMLCYQFKNRKSWEFLMNCVTDIRF